MGAGKKKSSNEWTVTIVVLAVMCVIGFIFCSGSPTPKRPYEIIDVGETVGDGGVASFVKVVVPTRSTIRDLRTWNQEIGRKYSRDGVRPFVNYYIRNLSAENLIGNSTDGGEVTWLAKGASR